MQYNILMKYWKLILVIFGALGSTALGIDASDSLSGSRMTLLANVFGAKTVVCPTETVELRTENNLFCVDTFEAGVGVNCPVLQPISAVDTALNIADKNCKPESKKGILPWTNVTYNQAEQLCATVGKKLLPPSVWYQSALGTIDGSDCNIDGEIATTGKFVSCKSGIGAHDMIGNVWEFITSDNSKVGEFEGKNLPTQGYVAGVTTDGIALETTTTPSANFNNDYFWSNTIENKVFMRGGFYGGKTDAGIYSTHSAIDSNFSSPAIGFRCMTIKS